MELGSASEDTPLSTDPGSVQEAVSGGSMFKTRYSPLMLAAAVLLLAGAAGNGLAHHMVARVNLEEMTVRANRIFVGRCVAIKEGYKEIAGGKFAVTSYTFEVDQAIKGNIPRTFTFTQVGRAPRYKAKVGVMMHGEPIDTESVIHGMTTYQVGEKALLFLGKPDPESQMSLPVGMYQGAFLVTQMPSGQELVRNSLNNRGLFTAGYTGSAISRSQAKIVMPEQDNPISPVAGLSTASEALANRRGALPLAPLVQLVDQINVAHGNTKGAIVQ